MEKKPIVTLQELCDEAADVIARLPESRIEFARILEEILSLLLAVQYKDEFEEVIGWQIFYSYECINGFRHSDSFEVLNVEDKEEAQQIFFKKHQSSMEDKYTIEQMEPIYARN